MKKQLYFICLLAFCTPSVLAAQQTCQDYICNYNKAKIALSQKKFKEAIDYCKAAKAYPNANNTEADALIYKIFEKIEAQKVEAEKQRNRAEIALKELQKTSKQVVQLLLNQIDQNILKLEFDSAFTKCETALSLKVNRKEVEKRVLEIAYVYTESDTFDAAIKLLNLLYIKTEPNRTFLRKKIAQIGSLEYFNFLEERYYPKMITVGKGEFDMGRDEDKDATEKADYTPIHRVRIDSFQLAETETTYWQYFIFTKSTNTTINAPSWGFLGDNPAVKMKHSEAVAYTRWLSIRFGRKYRLPTEAEWEFAAQGGNTTSTNVNYAGSNNIDSVAWFNQNASDRTHSIKLKKPNDLKIFDITGNVYEFCSDWYDNDITYYAFCKQNSLTINPKGPDTGNFVVTRGGAFNMDKQRCCIYRRESTQLLARDENTGFRCVKDFK